jgi:hypothetical protein
MLILGHAEAQASNAMLLSKRIDSNPYFILQTNSVGAFTQLRKAPVDITKPVCPSDRMVQRGCHWCGFLGNL